MKKVLIIQHLTYEGPGTIEIYLRKSNIYFEPRNLNRGATLEGCSDFSHIVVMGGFMAVYEMEKYTFLKEEMKFLEKAIKKGKQILGVCLGAQMLAHVLGGKVYKGPKEEIGWYEIEPTEDGIKDKSFSRLIWDDKKVKVFQWHGDTFDLPEGATLLASSQLYPNQAFLWKNNVYGLQFHIEVDDKMIREWFPDGSYLPPPFSWNTFFEKSFSFYESFFGKTKTRLLGGLTCIHQSQAD
ncbi:MAG: type 1 glutamine amidotransferase [Thermodesulforhabdaceae bacterium]